MPYLTTLEATKVTQTYRYFVQLASQELDHEGIPESFKTIDVVVAEPTEAAIAALIGGCSWLAGWTLVSYWKPELDSPF